VGILLIASFFPAERLWGFNWYGYFGWGTRLLMLGAAAVVSLMLMQWRRIRGDDSGPNEHGSKEWISVLALAIFVSVLATAFYLLRTRTHFLGDGYQLLASLQEGVNHKPWEAGAFLIQRWVYALLGGSGEAPAELALLLISGGAGLLLALVTGFVSVRLFRSTEKRLLYSAGVMTGGYALLFFGYLESYPLFVLAVGGFCQIGLLIALGKASRWFVIPLLALAVSFHIFGVALLPGAIYLFFRNSAVGARIAGLGFRVKAFIIVALTVAGGAVFVHYYTTSYFFRFTIVPLLTDRHTVEGYTLFSSKHLLDYVSHFFQLFPALLMAAIAVMPRIGPAVLRRPEYLFTLLVLLPSTGLVFIFNPGLGMPRDWDLFSFAGVPLVTILFYALLDARNAIKNSAVTSGLAIILGLLVLTPRVVTQVVPNLSIAVFDNYSKLDTIRNGFAQVILLEYLEKHGQLAERTARELANTRLWPYVAWDREGRELFKQGKIPEAEAKFRQTIDYAPCYGYAWANLGVCFSQREEWDSAFAYLRIADALHPFNSDIYNSLGFAYMELGNLDKAEEYSLGAIRLRPTNFTARTKLADLYWKQGRREELVKLLLESADQDSVPAQYFFESADKLLKLGETDAATRICRRALESGVDSSLIMQLEADYPGYEFTPAGH
jgi:tetratricopeptide (TPR) repeat protein